MPPKPDQATLFPDIDNVIRSATISECGLYRYDLRRSWAVGPHITFLMFNPSTADGKEDDPTITRCIGFAKSWGFSGLYVVNLYAYRATKVSDLWKAPDPIGPDNDMHICVHAYCGPVIAAWGAKSKAKARVAEVYNKILKAGGKLHAIRETKGGHPEHPLFLPGHLKAYRWIPKE